MSDVRTLISEALSEIVETAAHGGPRVRVALQSDGSEHGPLELVKAARLAQEQSPNIKVVMIGPKKVKDCDDLEWIETGDCEAELESAMDEALKNGTVAGIVAMHHPFPTGVTTIGRVFTPAFGRDMLIASTTGTSAINRVEAMIRNTEAQANLHETLVSETARQIFDMAKHYGAIGWKVNGAGGDGGSVTILSGPDHFAQKAMLEEIKTIGGGVREIGIRLNDSGVRVISD